MLQNIDINVFIIHLAKHLNAIYIEYLSIVSRYFHDIIKNKDNNNFLYNLYWTTKQEFFDSGILSFYCVYKDRKPHGKVKVYNENGNLQTEISYQNGILNGYYKIFWLDGRLLYKHLYINGKRSLHISTIFCD